MYDDNAPLFFAKGISGVNPAGPNVTVSFAVDIPSADNSALTQRVNLRVVIPKDSLAQGADFLTRALQQADAPQRGPTVQ